MRSADVPAVMLCNSTRKNCAKIQVWQAWDVVAPVKPQLYLSSQADALIPRAEINLFKLQQVGQPPNL